jgi:CRP/FNR family transcriptional regulator, cyclic AMP receptor protein
VKRFGDISWLNNTNLFLEKREINKMSCNAEELAGIELFELLDSEELDELAAVIDEKKLKEGEILFQSGDFGESMYIVDKGEVELFIKDTTGQKIVLKIAKENDIFGEISMLDNRPRSATAVALTDTELFVLDRDDLILLFQKKPDAGLNMLAAMSGMLREADNLLRTRVSKNVNDEMEEKLSTLQHIADWIAWFSGSMQFLIINALIFIVWIGINIFPFGVDQFDPFPFGLLTMIVSLEAIFLSCFVLISQNRQSEKDHIRSDIEYEVNIKAELEVAHLHEKIDHVHEQMLERFNHIERILKAKS